MLFYTNLKEIGWCFLKALIFTNVFFPSKYYTQILLNSKTLDAKLLHEALSLYLCYISQGVDIVIVGEIKLEHHTSSHRLEKSIPTLRQFAV